MSLKSNLEKKTIPDNLKKLLFLTRGYKGEYEYETNLEKLLDKISKTNPFSVLIFYESPDCKLSQKEIKKLNKGIPENFLKRQVGYDQFYFMPEIKERRRGNSLGTQYRETHTIYARAFSKLSIKKNILTYILIKDKNHEMKYVSSEKFTIHRHGIDADLETIEEILNNSQYAYAIKNNGIIENIVIE